MSIEHGTQEYHDLVMRGACGPITPQYIEFAKEKGLCNYNWLKKYSITNQKPLANK